MAAPQGGEKAGCIPDIAHELGDAEQGGLDARMFDGLRSVPIVELLEGFESGNLSPLDFSQPVYFRFQSGSRLVEEALASTVGGKKFESDKSTPQLN